MVNIWGVEGSTIGPHFRVNNWSNSDFGGFGADQFSERVPIDFYVSGVLVEELVFGPNPDPSILAFFFGFLFIVFRFSFLLCVFALFSKDFKGSADRKIQENPCFLSGIACLLFQQAKARIGGSGQTAKV